MEGRNGGGPRIDGAGMQLFGRPPQLEEDGDAFVRFYGDEAENTETKEEEEEEAAPPKAEGDKGDAGRANARFGLGMPPVPGEAERQATAEQEKAQGEKEAAAPKADAQTIDGWLSHRLSAAIAEVLEQDLHAAFEALLESLTDEKYDLSIASFRWQWVESGKTLKQLEAKGRLVLQLYDFGSGTHDSVTCWGQAMQHWHKKLPVLGKVAVMLTTYPGSAEVEQNFSLVEMFTAKRQAAVFAASYTDDSRGPAV
ncbi:hypothetical protein AK812_SmicGene20777 [Symbiodinium microadriaticum]|uniref:Uncharacterized protein n=1 Tax=Symbiodinium microadriaticum TaxID=2951 RepID=A0A1Q9DP23_SYMMI|nr:hypothetical protein AK812_SmicGene20777 [Symbiodinium microadriaticum]